jgi:hypothetical protein
MGIDLPHHPVPNMLMGFIGVRCILLPASELPWPRPGLTQRHPGAVTRKYPNNLFKSRPGHNEPSWC